MHGSYQRDFPKILCMPRNGGRPVCTGFPIGCRDSTYNTTEFSVILQLMLMPPCCGSPLAFILKAMSRIVFLNS